MNREFLKNAGVPDEAIDAIMAEHGKDIQAEKAKAESTAAELETYKTKVADLEKRAGSNDTVRKELDDLKAKIEADRKAAEDKAAEDRLNDTIRRSLPADRKFVNEYTEREIISQVKAELAKPENTGRGVGEILTELTKDKDGIFANPNAPADMPGFNPTTVEEVDEDKIRRVMGLKPRKE